jgi:hypothetical protein
LLEERGWLYVFGTGMTETWMPQDVKLARVLPRDIGRYDLWQFLTPDGWKMLPTGPAATDLETVAQGGSTEMSVHREVRDGVPSLVMVQVDPFAQDVVVRVSAAREVASVRWAEPGLEAGVRRFSLPELDPETRGGMNWAGRAHPHQSTEGTGLLVSYFSERAHSLRFVNLPSSELGLGD